jgi:hypothetical protein
MDDELKARLDKIIHLLELLTRDIRPQSEWTEAERQEASFQQQTARYPFSRK